jgi:hypothetical protein
MITYPHILYNSTITFIGGTITYMRYGNPNTSYNMKLSELKTLYRLVDTLFKTAFSVG